MKQRVAMIGDWIRDESSIAKLSRIYGVSRVTIYKWLERFEAEGDLLTMVSADGFRLVMVTLDYDGDEGQVLINRDELKGVINALKPPIVRP